MCRRGTPHRGAPVDLDVKDADIHDVMRLLADVGNVNIVVADSVQGKVTLKLKRVAWDLVACTIASLHKLQITAKDNVVLVTKPPK
jgi:type IV pilus assembly protein PilQ